MKKSWPHKEGINKSLLFDLKKWFDFKVVYVVVRVNSNCGSRNLTNMYGFLFCLKESKESNECESYANKTWLAHLEGAKTLTLSMTIEHTMCSIDYSSLSSNRDREFLAAISI